MPRQMPNVGISGAGVFGSNDFAFGASLSESGTDNYSRHPFKLLFHIVFMGQFFAIDEMDVLTL